MPWTLPTLDPLAPSTPALDPLRQTIQNFALLVPLPTLFMFFERTPNVCCEDILMMKTCRIQRKTSEIGKTKKRGSREEKKRATFWLAPGRPHLVRSHFFLGPTGPLPPGPLYPGLPPNHTPTYSNPPWWNTELDVKSFFLSVVHGRFFFVVTSVFCSRFPLICVLSFFLDDESNHSALCSADHFSFSITKWVETHKKLKRRHAQRIATQSKERWTRQAAEWNPGLNKSTKIQRRAGRPAK